MTEKPLHVRVAEKLGRVSCDRWLLIAAGMAGPVYQQNCSHKDCYPERMPPRYDTDWSATGPLIERFGLQVRPWAHDPKATPETAWMACRLVGDVHPVGTGATSLLAVCDWIDRSDAEALKP